MPFSSTEIIKKLDEKYPKQRLELELKNYADRNFDFETKVINQYIIGVTSPDPYSVSVNHYEKYIKQKLNGVTSSVSLFPCPYYGYEIDAMKDTLSKLSYHYNVELDIDKMIASLKIPRDGSGTYFVVVTIIQYQIVYIK